jgi:glycosyltransferase involved in cell wall biosynthesis
MSNAQPIRVLHIITRLIVGGAQENTLLSVEGLTQLPGYEVELIAGVEGGPEGNLLPRARQTTKLMLVPELVRKINPLSDLIALCKLYRLIKRGRYHIVHTHSSKAGVLGRIAAKLAGTPIVVHTLHSLVFHDYQPWAVNRLLRLIKKACAPLTDQYISVSKLISQRAIEAGIAPAEKFRTIYSGMELDWFLNSDVDPNRARRKLGIPEGAPVVGKIARFFPLKGHHQLMEAAPAIVRNHPDVRFLLVGDGILQDQIRKRAQKLGIIDNFVFTGLVEPEQIPQMIAAMDVLVHTSLREGLARVLVQALAMGKPCICFDLDGAPEVVIDGQTGYLIRPGDIQGLANAVSRLLADPALRARLGRAGRKLVDPAFRADTMVRQIAALYQELLEKHAERIRAFNERRVQQLSPSCRMEV